MVWLSRMGCAVVCALLASNFTALADEGAEIEIQVTGATLVSQHWHSIYVLKTCQGCSEPTDAEKRAPRLQGHLIKVYRADADAGPITVAAGVPAASPFRPQLKESIQQSISVVHPFQSTTYDEDNGPASQALEAGMTFDWQQGRCEAIVPVNFSPGANTGGTTLLWEDGVFVVPKVQITVFILSREATLSLGPSHAGAGSNTLPLVRRESAGSMFTLRGCGVHPAGLRRSPVSAAAERAAGRRGAGRGSVSGGCAFWPQRARRLVRHAQSTAQRHCPCTSRHVRGKRQSVGF